MPQLDELLIDGRTWHRCPTCGRYRGYNTCRWCGRHYKLPAALRRHEAMCYNNPGRVCPSTGRTDCVDCLHPSTRRLRIEGLEPDPCGIGKRIERMAQLCDLGLVEGADGGPYRLTAKGEEWQAKGGGWPEEPERELMEANADA